MKSTAIDKICDALVDLLYDRPLEEIKIKDIIETAGVNKSSYYYHFYSKEDVMAAVAKRYADGMFDAMYSMETRQMSTHDAVKRLLSYFYDNRRLVDALWKNGYKQQIHDELASLLIAFQNQYSYTYLTRDRGTVVLEEGVLYDIMNLRFVSCMLTYLEYWKEHNFSIPIDLMVDYMRRAEAMTSVSYELKNKNRAK